MNKVYKAVIEVYPHSTGASNSIDQEAAGGRLQSVEFRAGGFEDAVVKAELFARGVATNPRVWMAFIKSLGEKS